MPRLKKDGTPDRRGAPKGARRRRGETDKYRNFKVCSKCGEEKRLADFPRRYRESSTQGKKYPAADPRRYRGECKECYRKTRAVSATPPNAKRQGRQRKRKYANYAEGKRKRRIATQLKLFEYLAEKGCCDCGIRDPRVLEFDHIDPAQKASKIARLVSDGFTWSSPKLRQEILRCRVICANCHRLHTIEQQSYYSAPELQERLAKLLGEHGHPK